MALYRLGSYPTAFQLAVLAMEEYAKAKWVDHVYDAQVTNDDFPTSPTAEQHWLKLLYLHPQKQAAFLWRDWPSEFAPSLHRAAERGDLDRRKQTATYVGLPKQGKLVDVNARVSVPTRITAAEARQMISVVAQEVKDVYKLIERNDSFFFISALDDVVTSHEAMFVFSWRHRSGLKSRRFRPLHY